MNNQEKFLVCVSNPECAEKLIQRGSRLAKAFKGQAILYHIFQSSYDAMDFNQLQTKLMFEGLANKYQLEIVLEPSSDNDPGSQIAQFAKEHGITQIVIGQAHQNRFEMLLKESLVNQLFQQLEDIDIHVVELNRDIPVLEEEYDKGVSGQLIQIGENKYALSFDADPTADMKGTFFKLRASDFANGFFVIKKGEHHLVHKVRDGEVTIPTMAEKDSY